MEMETSKKDWLSAAAIAGVVVLAYLFISTRTTLWDRDEPRFTRAAVEMVESGNYLVPSFNGKVWADKPILTYWLMSAAVKIFGASEFAFRFWGAIGTAVTCLLTFYIGRKLAGGKAGLWAMIVLATSMMVMVVGTMATSDAVTLPFTVGAMAVFVNAITEKLKAWHVILMGILMGNGMLAKGPIGGLPVPVMIISLWFLRDNYADFFKRTAMITIACLIGIGIFLLWAIPANKATGGEFLGTFIGRHVLLRAVKPMEHHGGKFLLYLPYYLPVIIGGFFPWILFLESGIRAAVNKNVGGKKGEVVLLVWVVSIVVLMSLAATKLPHYIIFVWPAMAVLAGSAIAQSSANGETKWIKKGLSLFLPVGLGGAITAIAIGLFIKLPGLAAGAVMCGAVLLTMVIAATRALYKGKILLCAKIILCGVVLLQAASIIKILPVLEKIKISPYIAEQINKATTKDVAVGSYKFGEPSLNYYVRRNIEALSEAEAVEWTKTNGHVLVIPTKELERIIKERGAVQGKIIATKEGLNYSKGKKIEVAAVLCGNESK